MSANKRIPVSKKTWQKLGEMKAAGETYDELLEKMAKCYNRQKLIEKAQMARNKADEEVTSLDEL